MATKDTIRAQMDYFVWELIGTPYQEEARECLYSLVEKKKRQEGTGFVAKRYFGI